MSQKFKKLILEELSRTRTTGHWFDSSCESPDKCVHVHICVCTHLESDVMRARWNMLEHAAAEYRWDSL